MSDSKTAPSVYRDKVTADGSSGFKAAAGRYHIYLAEACPWCQRVEILLHLKGLTDAISRSYVAPVMGEIEGYGRCWVFSPESPDPLYNAKSMYELYKKSNPEHNGRCTVPVFWDKETHKLLSNESGDMLQFLNTEFQAFAKHPEVNTRPAELVKTIEEMTALIYPRLPTGVYKTGYAPNKEAYVEAAKDVFEVLDKVEEHLGKQRYMAGNQITEADINLFVSLLRFDLAFSCKLTGLRKLEQYPNILNYFRELYQHPAFKASVYWDKIRATYHSIPKQLPDGALPMTDMSIYEQPHDRDAKFPQN